MSKPERSLVGWYVEGDHGGEWGGIVGFSDDEFIEEKLKAAFEFAAREHPALRKYQARVERRDSPWKFHEEDLRRWQETHPEETF